MKRIAILFGLIAAFLCLAQSANAQYARKGANLVDRNGAVLTDQQIVKLVGDDVFNQTVVGARKQYKVGNGLLWGGVAGMGVGLTGSVISLVNIMKDGHSIEDVDSILDANPRMAALYAGSTILMSLGATAFSAGIVFKSIGAKRLDWVEGKANGEYSMVLNVGPTAHGVGVALNF